jgi:hypothetical protein
VEPAWFTHRRTGDVRSCSRARAACSATFGSGRAPLGSWEGHPDSEWRSFPKAEQSSGVRRSVAEPLSATSDALPSGAYRVGLQLRGHADLSSPPSRTAQFVSAPRYASCGVTTTPTVGRCQTGPVDEAVRDYIDAIAPERRPLFDRIDRLIHDAYPDAVILLSYQMPTYQVGRYRLYVGVWKHGVSLYGWEHGRDAGFAGRHPDLVTSKGTIKLRPDDAARVTDEEFRDPSCGTIGHTRPALARAELPTVAGMIQVMRRGREPRHDDLRRRRVRRSGCGLRRPAVAPTAWVCRRTGSAAGRRQTSVDRRGG